jgi:hypothetical protein
MPNAQRALGHSGLQQHATSLHTAVTSTAAAEGTHTSMAAVA